MARTPVFHKIALSSLAAFAAVFLCRNLVMPHTVSLSFDACIDAPQTFQVYYLDGSQKGFGQANWMQQKIDRTGEVNRVQFDLHVRQLNRLRLDFGSGRGRVTLKEARLSPGGALPVAAFSNSDRHQIDSMEIHGEEINLSFSQKDPYLVFTRPDVKTEARRRLNVPLFFSVWVLAYLLAFRVLDWLSWKRPGPDPSSKSRPKNTPWQMIASPNGLFLLAFAAFSLIPASRIDMKSTVSKENRMLETYKPLVNGSQLNTQYGPQFENWFSDRFRGRDRYIEAYDTFRFLLNRNIQNDHAFMGRESWIFTKAYNSVNMYRNANLFTEGELAKIDVNIDRLNGWAARTHRKVYIHFSPDKETLFGDYYPSYYKKVGPVSRLRQLLAFVKDRSHVVFVTSVDRLLQAKAEGKVIGTKPGSHMNHAGMFIEYEGLMERISKDFPEIHSMGLADFQFAEEPTKRTDLLRALNLSEEAYGRDKLLHTRYHQKRKKARTAWKEPLKEDSRRYGYMADTRNAYSGNTLKVFMVSDSFLRPITRYIAEDVQELTYAFVGGGRDFPLPKFTQAIDDLSPEIVIIGTTERFLDRLVRLDPPE